MLGEIMELSILKMDEEGRIVIPEKMRGDFKVGHELVALRNEHRLTLRKASDIPKFFLSKARKSQSNSVSE